MNIEQFFALSQGVWKSMRTSHTLAFAEFEDITSYIEIKNIDINEKRVIDLLKHFNHIKSSPIYALEIKWNSYSDWDHNSDNHNGETILVAIPQNVHNGIFLRSKGYTENQKSNSTYKLDDIKSISLNTSYLTTETEEKIWFISDNVRCRYSLIKSKNNSSIIQTSFSSEIRKINP